MTGRLLSQCDVRSKVGLVPRGWWPIADAAQLSLSWPESTGLVPVPEILRLVDSTPKISPIRLNTKRARCQFRGAGPIILSSGINVQMHRTSLTSKLISSLQRREGHQKPEEKNNRSQFISEVLS
jgi:hypothetical protein